MSDYFWAPSLVQLDKEINAMFPKRDQSSDGWIGDASHAARPSSHNPDWSAPGRRRGVVRGGDWDIDDNDARRDFRRLLLNNTIGDPRVWYVISNGIIYSRTYGWGANTYLGPNGHFGHVHVSLMETEKAEFDTTPWFGSIKKKAPAIDLSVLREEMKGVLQGRKPIQRLHVVRLQKALNARYGLNLATDGLAGDATLAAYRMHERETSGTGRPAVPDRESLTKLVRGRYRVVA